MLQFSLFFTDSTQEADVIELTDEQFDEQTEQLEQAEENFSKEHEEKPALDEKEKKQPNDNENDDDDEEKLVVSLKGLPFSATESEIMNFLEGKRVSCRLNLLFRLFRHYYLERRLNYKLEMLIENRKSIALASGFRIYLFVHFRQGNHIKITICQIN